MSFPNTILLEHEYEALAKYYSDNLPKGHLDLPISEIARMVRLDNGPHVRAAADRSRTDLVNEVELAYADFSHMDARMGEYQADADSILYQGLDMKVSVRLRLYVLQGGEAVRWEARTPELNTPANGVIDTF
jgi:hypothetical protein